MLEVMKGLQYKIEHDNNFVNIETQKYILHDWRQFEGNIRQNILFLPASLYQSKTIWPMPHGDIIGKRPIDGYFDVLGKFGLIATLKDDFIEVNKSKNLLPSFINLQMDSTGITICTIMILVVLCLEYRNLHDFIVIENISVDLEVEWFITFLNNNSQNNAFKFIQENKKIFFYPIDYMPYNQFTYTIPKDRIILFDIVLFIAMQQIKNPLNESNKIKISKNEFEYILGMEVISELNELGINIIYLDNSILIDAKYNVKLNNKKLHYDAKKYPFLSTDMLPILITYISILGHTVMAKDIYFEDRVSLLFEQIDKIKESSTSIIWESSNIRQTVCGIMFLVYTNEVECVVDDNNSIFRGYEKNFISDISKISDTQINTIKFKNGVKFKK
jgi:UDP-N-acetylglucosamine enolpyruvyl transferase